MWSGAVEPGGAEAARQVLEALAGRGETLATAESLTGGMLASLLTDVPGASRVFVGGAVTYASRVKISLLGVPDDVVERHGVVSQECALAMARGAASVLDATWAMATTGVAGPDEQEGHPAGTVWIAVAGPPGATARLLSLTGGRDDVRRSTCTAALGLLADVLLREDQGLG